MLSKKMAVSLTSLITILALAFVVVPAMAADDFDATFSVVRVSTKSDHNAEYAKDIPVTLTFGAQVDGTAATLTIFVEDKFGSQTSVTAPTITKKDLDSVQAGLQNDNKTSDKYQTCYDIQHMLCITTKPTRSCNIRASASTSLQPCCTLKHPPKKQY